MTQTYPTIPAAEYPERWDKVRAMMARQGLDLVVAYGDDRAVAGAAHPRWLANFMVHFEPACVVVPPTGDPVLLCGPESREYAVLTGRVPDVRVLKEFTHPDEDYPHSAISSLAEVAARLAGKTARRIGLAGRALMGVDLVAAFQRALPGVEWIDVESAMSALRAQKSPAELAVIRHAYRIAEKGLQAAVDAIAPGVTERAVAAEAEAAMRRAGSEGMGIDTIVASGPNARPILARTTFRPIAARDMVLLTVAPRYEGYHGAIGRPVLVGDAAPEIRRALDVACRAQEASFKAMRPGIEGRAVEKAGRDVVGEAGLGRHFLYSGVHSVGVIEFEAPIFGPSSPARLAENMIISVDIPLFDAPWGGMRVEDGFRVTATGAERLNQTPYVIQK